MGMAGKSRERGSVSAQSSYNLFKRLAVIQHPSRATLLGNSLSTEPEKT